MSTDTQPWKTRPRSWKMLLGSSIGKKVIMAVTGLIMVGFVVMHMLGNTLLFAGSEPLPFTDMSAMNFYGWMIQEGSHGAVWGVRAVMLAAVSLHVWAAVTLTQQNAAARPERYHHGRQRQKSTLFSLTMRYSGVLLLLYIVGHVAHITLGFGVPNFEFGQPYETVVSAFQNPVVAVAYMVANAALGFHLFHATWSSLKTLGFDHPQYESAGRALSIGLALLVSGVNVLFPLAVLLGAIA